MVLNLSGLEVFPGDLLVSDGAADYLCHPLLLLNSGPVHSAYLYYIPAVGWVL